MLGDASTGATHLPSRIWFAPAPTGIKLVTER
jgi:hypothetical protein